MSEVLDVLVTRKDEVDVLCEKVQEVLNDPDLKGRFIESPVITNMLQTAVSNMLESYGTRLVQIDRAQIYHAMNDMAQNRKVTASLGHEVHNEVAYQAVLGDLINALQQLPKPNLKVSLQVQAAKKDEKTGAEIVSERPMMQKPKSNLILP